MNKKPFHRKDLQTSVSTPTLTEVFEKAMQIILVRQHSKKELREKLLKKYPEQEELIQNTIERLLELNYLNDDTYAEALTKNRLRIKRKGLFWIRNELKQQGIKAEKIQHIVETYQDAETLSLEEAAQKKYATLKKDLTTHEKKQKLAAYLQRRGYPLEKILHVLNNSL